MKRAASGSSAGLVAAALLWLIIILTAHAQPVITSFSPVSGPIGSSITITGANFSAIPSNNIVYFGGVRAAVVAADANSLTVMAPTGASYAPITVTVQGLTAYSRMPFLPTFPSDRVLDATSFGPQIDLVVNKPNSMELADFDGDGRLDIIAVEYTGGISVRRNVSSPGNLSTASFLPPVFFEPGGSRLAVADLDGDGKLDLATVNSSDPRFFVVRNTSTPGSISGELLPPIELGFFSGVVDTADFDLDGRPDVLIGKGLNVAVLRNLSQGTNFLLATDVDFPAVETLLIHRAVGDVDGDGKPDIAVLDHSRHIVSLFRNTTSGSGIDTNSFAPRVELVAGSFPIEIGFGDLDGDGKLDLASANGGSDTASILRNTAVSGSVTANSFAPKIEFSAGGQPNGLGLGDLDGDGKVDLAVANFYGSSVSVFKNIASSGTISSNSLASAVNLPVGSFPYYARIADLDGDSKPEIVVPSFDRATIAILTNNVLPPGPPVVTSQPRGVIAKVGEQVMLNAVVTGTRPMGYQWTLNGTNLPGATDAALVLTNFQFANAGIYALALSNELGTATSSNAVLVATSVGPIRTGVNGSGSIGVSPQANQYLIDQTISLTVTSGRYHTFLRWSDGITTNPRTVTVGASNTAFVAIFTNAVPLETLVFKQWERVFGGDGADFCNVVRQTPDSGFILAGSSASSTNEPGNKTTRAIGLHDYWVVRLDANGTKIWERTLGTTGQDYLNALEVLSDGGFILAGQSGGSGGDRQSAHWQGDDFWLVKLNSAGDTVWERSFGGSADDVPYSVQSADNGSFLVAGNSLSDAGTGNKSSASSGADSWLVKIASDGSKLWDRSYGGPHAELTRAVRQTFDGGYLLAGELRVLSELDVMVIRTDIAGELTWSKTFGGSGPPEDRMFDAELTADGGSALIGYSQSPVGPTKSSPNYGTWDGWLLRLDSHGNRIWDNSFGGDAEDSLVSIASAGDGGFFLAGYSRSSATGNKNTATFGQRDAWVIRTDPSGNLLRQQSLGGSELDEFASVIQTPDGYVVAGASSSGATGNKETGNFGAWDYWVLKFRTREAPVGTPIALVNGEYSPSNSFVFGPSNIVTATLQTSFTNGAIFYTLDDSTPTTNSLRYTEPFQLIGSTIIHAIAYNSNRTQSAEMDAVTVTINNAAPTVTFSPSTTFYLNPGSNTLLSVTATDTEGAVIRVEFYQGTNLLSAITDAPYEFVWTNPPSGRHSITARAYDPVGAFGQTIATINVVAGTIVSGVVSGQTWAAQSGPYYVAGNVQVTNLTIEPGVTVLFGGNYQFEVLGQFSATGSNPAPIHFTTDTNISGWGGIYFNSSSGPLRMEDCIVERSMNSGIRIHDCSPILRHCTIRWNSALRGAGVMTDSSLLLESCTILGNTITQNYTDPVPGGSHLRGAGIYSESGTLRLRGCSVRDNVLFSSVFQYGDQAGGGGIYSAGPTFLEDSDVSGNRATAHYVFGARGGRGGGIFCQGTLECLRTSITSNQTCVNWGSAGGGVAVDGPAVLHLCIFRANKSGAQEGTSGGAIQATSSLWMTNCLVAENEAGPCPGNPSISAGAISANAGMIENCTIVYNTGQGAVDFKGVVRNSIIYFNGPGPQIWTPPAQITVAHSAIQGGFEGSGNISSNPSFTNQTTYLLNTVSPCIDAGDPDALFNDACFPPSLGNQRNDMGAYGGPFACGWSEFGVARPTVLVNGQSSLSNAFVFGTSNVVFAEIQSPFSNGTIFYSLDGNAPTTNSFQYTGPVQLVRSATLWAMAFNSNRTEVAISYRIVVTINNNPPVVNLIAPTNGTTYIRGQNIALAATASDSDGPVQRVEFYGGANLLATLTNTPWSLVWSNVQGGNYALRAVVYDHVGASSTSSVNVAVWAPVTVELQGSGGVSRSPDKLFYAVGETATLTATSARYYRFVRWSTGETNATLPFIVGATNVISALFTNAIPLEELLFEQWQRSWGGSGEDFLKVALQTRDGGLLLAGESTSPTNSQKTAPAYGQFDWWLIKLDASGNEQWQRTYGGSGGEALQFVRQTAEGGYILGGYSTSGADGNKTTAPLGGEDWWVVKINATGQIEWQRAFGESSHDDLMDGFQTEDGGYLLAGSGDGAVWLMKVDAFGFKQSELIYGSAGGANSIRAADGGYLLAGQYNSPSRQWDWWIVKVDSALQFLWERLYGGFQRDDLYSALALPDGTFVLGGFSMSPPADTKDAPNYGGWDQWIARIDASGDKLWDQSYGGSSNDWIMTTVADRRGGFLFGGLSYSPADGNKTATNFGSSDYWIVRTDAAGVRNWEGVWGGDNTEFLETIAPLNDGYLLGGSSYSGPSGNKTTPTVDDHADWWIIKLLSHEVPVGTPVVLVNGQFSSSNAFHFTETNVAIVTLQSSFTNGTIRYTLDGSAPLLYTGAFALTNTAAVRRTFAIRPVAWNSDSTVSITGEVVTVTFTPRPLTLTQLGRGSITASPDQFSYALGQSILLTATADRWYQFVSWSDGNTNRSRPITIGPSNHYYAAIFTNALPLEELVFSQWERTYGGTGNDRAHIVRRTTDGGFMVGGSSSSGISGNKTNAPVGSSGLDGWIIKTDAAGERQWERAFGGTGDDHVIDIVLTSDGGYLLICATSSGVSGNKTAGFFGVEDFWLIKLDADGNKLFEREFGSSAGDAPGSASQTSDGGFIFAGVSDSPTGGNKTAPHRGLRDMWLYKLDADANPVWDATYGSSFDDSANMVLPARDGGYLLVGAFSQTPQNRQLYTVKVNSSGGPEWAPTFGTGVNGGSPNMGFGAQHTIDHGFLVFGITPQTSGNGKTAALHGDFDFWLLRLDSAGNKLWDQSYGGSAAEEPGGGPGCFQITPDGACILAGSSASPISGNKTTSNYGSFDGWAVKTDPGGDKKWELNLGGSAEDRFSAAAVLPDGFLFVGASQSTNGTRRAPAYGGNDLWMVRIATREAPVGTPVVLVNGQYSPSNHFVLHETNVIEVQLVTTLTNSSFPAGNIYFTLDGTEPDVGAEFYAGPFIVSNSVVIRAVAYDEFFSPPGAFMDPAAITVLPLYSLMVSTPGGGSLSNAPLAALYPSNTVVTITAIPNAGWSFMEWNGDAAGTNPVLTVSMNRAKQVQAIFGTLVTTTNTGSGLVLRNPPQGPYPYNSKVRLSALPDPGRFFSTWADAASGSISPIDFTATNPNPRVIGVFGTLAAGRQSLTALVSGDGSVTKNPQAVFYNHGVTVQLTANPRPGSFFAGWSGDASGGNNPLPVLMNTNKVITANFATTPVNLPPTVDMLTPSDGVTFSEPADITISANAADPDGSIIGVEFFEGTNLLGTVSAAPFTFAWTNLLAGEYVLTVQAVDNGGVRGLSAPVHVTVATLATNPPVFFFSSAVYDVHESAPNVTLTVLKSAESGPASVNFITLDGNARSGFGSGGDYAFASGSLSFTNGDTQKTISIAIREDLLMEGMETFTVTLSSPSHGGVLGNPSAATVRITDNEIAATNSVIERVFPATPPSADGLLRVTLEPPEAFGQWRFAWEPRWRDGGVLVPGLVPGNYEIEFKAVPLHEQPRNMMVPVTENAFTSVTNYYLPTETPRLGALRVDLLPETIAPLAQWRRQGETNWHASSETVSNLSAGMHIVEFRPVTGRVTPPARGVTVVADQENAIAATYLVAESPPGTPPSRLGFSTIVESPYYGLPYGYAGQISSALGFGSGFVVKERVVLTAAHVVFDDVNLSYIGEVFWFFQRHRGEFEPRPQTPRGWYVFSAYSAAREADNTPGVSTPASQDQDVAALYFLEPAGRGGSGGYLMSENSPNEWLTGSRQRLLVGYPVEMLPDLNDVGKMHATVPFTAGFTHVSNQVYATTQVKSFPGNSGGPLCVMYTNNVYYPAAIYLGGSNQTIVRAIDARVVDMINRAEVSGNEGGNQTGGGIITIIPPLPGNQVVWGAVEIHLGPPSAIALGGAWRVSPTNTAYKSYTNFTSLVRTIPLQSGAFTIEFKDLPGFHSPTSQVFQIITDQVVPIYPRYAVFPPRLDMDLQTGLSITGTRNTTYRIERTAQLPPAPWITNSTITLAPGPTRVPGTSPTNAPSRFYRAIWLP